MFDYKKTYYKVTNEKECHNGYQYHNGLNILPDEFNDDPKESCVKGGFYFTDYEHLCEYFVYGTYIREIKIPKDARVIKDISGDKWRTDKIILGKRYHIKNDFDKWFNADKFNWQYSFILPKDYSKYFNVWWYPDKFNWKYSYLLAKYCSKEFEKWWDSNKYDWIYSDFLAEYCSEYFDKWFDSDKYNWRYFDYLLKYCLNDLLNQWFDEKMLKELIEKIKAKKRTKKRNKINSKNGVHNIRRKNNV